MKTEGEKSSFLKCIPKSNVILKFFWVLVFGIGIWYLAYPRDRSFIAKVVIKSQNKNEKNIFVCNLLKSDNFKLL